MVGYSELAWEALALGPESRPRRSDPHKEGNGVGYKASRPQSISYWDLNTLLELDLVALAQIKTDSLKKLPSHAPEVKPNSGHPMPQR
jgi:hypothetical protein